MPTEQQRAKFEAWIYSQPRETPGYAIETAWAAWQAALQAQQPGKYRGVGELERSGYIPAGSADEREAQQPGAQAVAWRWVDKEGGTDLHSWRNMPPHKEALEAKKNGLCGIEYAYTHPQPPSIPEPSEDDVEAAKDAFDDVYDGMPGSDRPSLRAALTTYTARLRERIGGTK